MSELNKPQNLADWRGDVESLIVEMKRLAGVSTDSDLAVFLGVTQGAVANWRRRGGVPESTLLSFERLFAEELGTPQMRAALARAMALRLVHYDANQHPDETGVDDLLDVYLRLAGNLDIIEEECFTRIREVERSDRVSPEVAYLQLLMIDGYISRLSDWAKEITVNRAFKLEKVPGSSMVRRLASHRHSIRHLRDL